MRKTKIVCTIGPVSEDENTLKKLINAGMDVARFNFSHGDYDEHRNRFITTVNLAKKMMDAAQVNPKYSDAVKKAFVEAYEELSAEDLTLENLNEIKNMLD